MMRPGPLVRSLFGPYEHEIAEAYRRIFIDLDDFAAVTGTWAPQAERILEVGCGEGAMTERLVRAYPAAEVTGIDITPKVGRLFRGPASRVRFKQETIESLAEREPGSADLVVLSDVMHHVPLETRGSILAAIAKAMAPNGKLVFKDWVISASPVHWLCEASDRYLTGDDVSYFTQAGITAMLGGAFGNHAIRQTQTVRPWRNNVAVLVQP